ncbi:MAG: hypothetical protein AAFP83_13545 [Bacteroidota bacterium]
MKKKKELQISIQKKVCEGVSGWLLFEFSCFRGLLFNEKYLSYPIGQILNSATQYKTHSEVNHPFSNGGKGRPLQVDFVLKEGEENGKLAFESKWVGDSMISLGSLIWDLIRLQNLHSQYTGLRCYFVLAGFDKKLNVLLSDFDICYDENSIKENSLTKVNSTYLMFNLFKLDDGSRSFINEKIEKYSKFGLFSRITCRPAHKFPKKDVVNMTFSTYVFEVCKPDMTHRIEKL